MEKIKYYIEKYKLYIIIGVLLMLILLSSFLVFKPKNSNNIEKIQKIEEIKENKEEKKEVIKIAVDIKGLVEIPGVYELDEGSRVIDAINRAGGLKENANTEYINLSKKLTDEMIIIIYSNDEVEKFKEVDKEIIYIKYECDCPDNINDACITNKDTVNTNGNKTDTVDIKDNVYNTDKKISINTGTLEELQTLDGVGESKAKAIIEYREENGEFKSIEDIMNVSGIGEKAYTKIKDNIKL